MATIASLKEEVIAQTPLSLCETTLASGEGGRWSTQALASFEAGGSGTALAVDSAGRAHVALHDGSTGALQVISLRTCE